MTIDVPSFDDLRSILANADEGTRAEADAFLGRGLWSVDGEAARLAELARRWPAHVIRDESGKPVLAIGLSLVRIGVVQTWFVGAAGWQAHNAAIVGCYRMLVCGVFAGGIHRITVESLAGRPRVREWFERFGFVHEGTERAAGVQGEDVDIYGMTREVL